MLDCLRWPHHRPRGASVKMVGRSALRGGLCGYKSLIRIWDGLSVHDARDPQHFKDHKHDGQHDNLNGQAVQAPCEHHKRLGQCFQPLVLMQPAPGHTPDRSVTPAITGVPGLTRQHRRALPEESGIAASQPQHAGKSAMYGSHGGCSP